MTNNKTVLSWVEEIKALVNPSEVVWIDGSKEQADDRQQKTQVGKPCSFLFLSHFFLLLPPFSLPAFLRYLRPPERRSVLTGKW